MQGIEKILQNGHGGHKERGIGIFWKERNCFVK